MLNNYLYNPNNVYSSNAGNQLNSMASQINQLNQLNQNNTQNASLPNIVSPIPSVNTQNDPLLNDPIHIPTACGRKGVEDFVMPPNSSASILDTTDDLIWIKTTDPLGHTKSIAPYRIALAEDVINTPESVQNTDISKLEKRIEELERRLNVNDSKSNTSKSK